MADLKSRLSKIEQLERELTKKAAPIIRPGSPMYVADLFAFGAANRTLAQSRGFRTMIDEKNFPSAAILLRTQIDTAMRVNGLKYLDTPDAQLREVFQGNKTFRELVSWEQTPKGKAIKMQDKYLLERLKEDEAWIGEIYEQTSDFVHLSFRHFLTSAHVPDSEDEIINFVINGEDISRDESSYYEICDAFFNVSKLTCTLILGFLISQHSQDAKD